MLEVRDTGVGMDATTSASAFEPFFTTKAPGVGTGLGLANALATVSAAGGTIDVDSVPDVGTTMTVSLPMTTPESTPRLSQLLPVGRRTQQPCCSWRTKPNCWS